jgi:hypothetical protein
VKFLRNNNGKAIEKTATVTLSERPKEKEMLNRQLRRRQER